FTPTDLTPQVDAVLRPVHPQAIHGTVTGARSATAAGAAISMMMDHSSHGENLPLRDVSNTSGGIATCSHPVVENTKPVNVENIRPQSRKDSQDLTKDDNIITSEKKPKGSTEVPVQRRTSSSVPTFCDVVVNDQSTHATSSQANAENRDPNIDRQHESRDVRLSHLDMSHLNGEGSSQLQRPKQEKINDNTNNQSDSSQAGKMKTNQAYSARAHPYKFPFKCNRIPKKNRDHVLEYPEWDFPSLDQHCGGLDVLDLKKVAYLGGPNKQDVMLCESGKDSKKKYVLKFFPQKSERFLRELKAVKDIQHPYIVRPISYRSVRSVCYTVTNYFPRGSLANYIGQLPIQTIVRYFLKIANGLSFLHACHVTHRDLRPENIMIDDCDNPMISDFDMSDTLRPGAGITEPRRRTADVDINFIRRYGTKKDAFSLGAVLHCMMFEVQYHEHYDFFCQAKNATMPDCPLLHMLRDTILNLVTPDWSARWNVNRVLDLFVKHHSLLSQFCDVLTLEELDPLFAKLVERSQNQSPNIGKRPYSETIQLANCSEKQDAKFAKHSDSSQDPKVSKRSDIQYSKVSKRSDSQDSKVSKCSDSQDSKVSKYSDSQYSNVLNCSESEDHKASKCSDSQDPKLARRSDIQTASLAKRLSSQDSKLVKCTESQTENRAKWLNSLDKFLAKRSTTRLQNLQNLPTGRMPNL
ncbi:hypothetical protein RRG08_041425, partial [Elysia crispata]